MLTASGVVEEKGITKIWDGKYTTLKSEQYNGTW
jgi:hypothetical protein